MSKRKKRKVVHLPQSLEAKIRTRARNLKLGSCYISNDWELMREGNIVVSRVHSNGNLTVGFFLVDLALRGVKDAFYDFNIDEKNFLDMINRDDAEGKFIEIEYEIVHNIIYGAIEYAEGVGFKPCKEYAIAKYILEEDDEIPFIDIEFGAEGMPTVICNNEDPKLSEIKQLERVVGLGNFQVINTDESDAEIFDDFEGNLMHGWDDDIDEIGVPDWENEEWIHYFKKKPSEQSFRVTQYFVDMLFLEKYDEELDAFDVVLGGAKFEDSLYETLIKEEEISAIDDIMTAFNTEDRDNISKILMKNQKKFPLSVTINSMAIVYNSEFKSIDETMNSYEDLRKLIPDNITFLNIYSSWLIDVGLLENVTELFNDRFSLKEFNPDKVFTTNEVIEFCTAYCNYFMVVGDLWEAEPYYQVLDTLNDDNPAARIIIQNMVVEKMAQMKDEDFST